MYRLSVSGSALAIITVLTLSAICQADQYCRKDKIKDCLLPSYAFLDSSSKNEQSFLRISLKHYMSLLVEGELHNEIHIHSLSTILLPLDKIILNTEHHAELCGKLNESNVCLEDHVDYCATEVGDELRGIMDVFREVCSPFAKQAFQNEAPCILNNAVQKVSDEKCMTVFNKSLDLVNSQLDCLNSNNTPECEDASNYATKLLNEGDIILKDDSGAHIVVRAQVCQAVDNALHCYKDAVLEVCKNPLISDKEYAIRSKLVHYLLLADLGCPNFDGTYCNVSQFACSNGECIGRSLTCDGKTDCGDGSDESKRMCDESSSTWLTVTLIVVAVLAFIIVIGICVTKVIQERKESEHFYPSRRSDSEEMINVLRGEGSVGRSTPPLSAHIDNDSHSYKTIQT